MFRSWMLLALFLTFTVSLTTVYSLESKVAVKEKQSVVVEKENPNVVTQRSKQTVVVEKQNPNAANQRPQGDGFAKAIQFVANLVRRYVLRPASKLLNFGKKIDKYLIDNLDKVLASISNVIYKALDVKVMLMTTIPKKIISGILFLFPNLDARLEPARQRAGECRKKLPLDHIKKDLDDVVQCKKPYVNSTLYGYETIYDRSLNIVKMVNQSLQQLENSNQQNRQDTYADMWRDFMQKGLPNVSDIIAAALDIVKTIKESMICFKGEEGKGLVGDLLTYQKDLFSCLLGGLDDNECTA